MTASCPSCRREPGICCVCGNPAGLHEHVYDEWYCRACWAAFGEPETSQDAEIYLVASA